MPMDDMKMGETLWKLHLDYVRVIESVLEKSASHGEDGVLLYLYHFAKPMYPGELTDKLGLTTGRIANILRALERNGLIERTTDGHDRRRVVVTLTPQGEALARKRYAEGVAMHTRVISALSRDEAQLLLGMVVRMIETTERRGEDMNGGDAP